MKKMINCEHVTRLSSEQQERRLSLRERLVLKLHTLMCRGCRNFDRQLPLLRQAARHYAGRRDGQHPDRDSEG
ncbi:MAG: hypothetical protein RQ899_14740 [Pseudomonadales bacterium]|nr:hypothetical protein [Pseudomonadales bacterium]